MAGRWGGYGKVSQSEDAEDWTLDDENERLPSQAAPSLSVLARDKADAIAAACMSARNTVVNMRKVGHYASRSSPTANFLSLVQSPRGETNYDKPSLKSTSPMLNRKKDAEDTWSDHEAKSFFGSKKK
jgi:hypothetical protein